ncbi:peptide methionine sulfoxide reductase MsrA isoform X2 [Syngnathoides biaculeatus]|nr:peptide methionine sulfoxide reductase MsrA isoform X2 [Syngnathoides biaculeatus]
MEMIMFGMGCFWGAEKLFWRVSGVFSTQVGFAGGFTPNPTYEEVCSGLTGHTEVVRVVFSPEDISLAELLKLFWENHDPTQGMKQHADVGTQYRSAIYTSSATQQELALNSKVAYQKLILTRVTGSTGACPSCQRAGGGVHPELVASQWQRCAGGEGHGCDHNRNCGVAGVLLRRGLPPAVPEEDTARLLRPQRHRRFLPHRRGERGALSSSTQDQVKVHTPVIELVTDTKSSALT